MESDKIATLLKEKRHDASIIPELEVHLDAQIKNNGYDLDANLALLKLYQFNSKESKATCIVKVLIKALMNLPHPDFTTCLYMVPLQLQVEEQQVVLLKRLWKNLETAKFSKFWALTEEEEGNALLQPIPGFSAAIREFIAHLLGLAYQTVSKQLLQEVLRLDGSSLDDFINKHSSWQNQGDHVALPLTEFNQAKQKKINENIEMQQMTKILANLSARHPTK
ncbi:Eukaryotic translation initiation factor 3 subunit K [Balamuthia mandrillaris]